jgi:FtsP/CotA-like multicopper oxidase with cupredoxin domain
MTGKVERDAAAGSLQLPGNLSKIERYSENNSVNASRPRPFVLGGGILWAINGRVFQMDEVARDEVVRLNTQETWMFDNTGSGGMGMGGGMGMMQMAHPMHVHGVHFQVVSRQVLPAYQQAWESLNEGYVDEGWKDTVLVVPGEQVKVLMRFQDFSGIFLNHCHNLEHEDLGMMRNYRIDP